MELSLVHMISIVVGVFAVLAMLLTMAPTPFSGVARASFEPSSFTLELPSLSPDPVSDDLLSTWAGLDRVATAAGVAATAAFGSGDGCGVALCEESVPCADLASHPWCTAATGSNQGRCFVVAREGAHCRVSDKCLASSPSAQGWSPPASSSQPSGLWCWFSDLLESNITASIGDRWPQNPFEVTFAPAARQSTSVAWAQNPAASASNKVEVTVGSDKLVLTRSIGDSANSIRQHHQMSVTIPLMTFKKTTDMSEVSGRADYLGGSFGLILLFSAALFLGLFGMIYPLRKLLSRTSAVEGVTAARKRSQMEDDEFLDAPVHESEAVILGDVLDDEVSGGLVDDEEMEGWVAGPTPKDEYDEHDRDDSGSDTGRSTRSHGESSIATYRRNPKLEARRHSEPRDTVDDSFDHDELDQSANNVNIGADDDDDDDESVMSSVVIDRSQFPTKTDNQQEGYVVTFGSIAHLCMAGFEAQVVEDTIEAERISGDFLSEVHTAALATDGYVHFSDLSSATVVWNAMIPRIAHENLAVQFAETMQPKLSQFSQCYMTITTGELCTSRNTKPPFIVGSGINTTVALSQYQQRCGIQCCLTEEVIFKTLSNQQWRVRPVDILCFAHDAFNEHPTTVYELIPANATLSKDASAANFLSMQQFLLALQSLQVSESSNHLKTVTAPESHHMWDANVSYFISTAGAHRLAVRGKYFRKEVGWALPWSDSAAAKRDQSSDSGAVEDAAADFHLSDSENVAMVSTDYKLLPVRFGPEGSQWARSEKRLATQKHGNVFLGMDSEGTPVAIATMVIDAVDPAVLAERLNGFVMGKRIKHRHSTSVATINRINDKFLMAVMEYLPGGELHGHISEFGTLMLECAKRYSKELLELIRYLYKLGVVHRLVSPRNILLSMDGTCKLANYRMAVQLSAADSWVPWEPRTAPQEYLAPEVAKGEPHALSDTFSFGKCVAAMLVGNKPWNTEDDLKRLFDAAPFFSNGSYTRQKNHAIDLILSATREDASARPTPDQLAFHSFFLGS